ncbi:MAG: EAL domain-containing protein [Nitrospinota bacterium]|jgi:diguanylate cyclase (GGDEF)-like protein|nr:EAL domain-containing protein [Nitrospinota bacterium]
METHHPIGVLLIEDNPGDARLLEESLREAGGAGFEITHARRLSSGLEELSNSEIDVVLLGLSLPDGQGLGTVENAIEAAPDAPIIVMTGLEDETLAVQAVRAGAQDYLVKGQMEGSWLVRSVRYAIERKRMQMELETAREKERHMARHDVLTGLPNRQMLYDRLRQMSALARRNGQSVAVMFLDVDRFKSINDQFGHSTGDQLLQAVAGRLTLCVRESDTVARLGGDEFTIVLGNIANGEDAARVARKILAEISKPILGDRGELSVTTSIGISLFPSDAREVEDLIKKADIAMYRAKGEGKDNYQFYNASLGSRAFERARIENGILGGLDKDEFVLHYQPQFDSRTDEISGFESLMRWRHPELGLLPPDKFIPLAGKSEFIVPMGEWALRTACAQIRKWQEEGVPQTRVSINLSARQFQDKALASKISRILENNRLKAEFLGLEITESTAMRDAGHTTKTLHSLKDLGVYVLVDDFGVGYSSLIHLNQFPIDFLKIDKSFVHRISANQEAPAILAAIISLAHRLDLKVIAEGVEIEPQREILTALDCDEMQGFYFSAPVSDNAVGNLFVRAGSLTQDPNRRIDANPGP